MDIIVRQNWDDVTRLIIRYLCDTDLLLISDALKKRNIDIGPLNQPNSMVVLRDIPQEGLLKLHVSVRPRRKDTILGVIHDARLRANVALLPFETERWWSKQPGSLSRILKAKGIARRGSDTPRTTIVPVLFMHDSMDPALRKNEADPVDALREHKAIYNHDHVIRQDIARDTGLLLIRFRNPTRASDFVTMATLSGLADLSVVIIGKAVCWRDDQLTLVQDVAA